MDMNISDRRGAALSPTMATQEPGSAGGIENSMTANQIAEAYRASLTEHRMRFSEAFKIYKKALFWSAVMCLVSSSRDISTQRRGNLPPLPGAS